MESAANLVEVVSQSQSPLPVVVAEDIIAIGEFGGVSVGLSGLESMGSSDKGSVVDIATIDGLRPLKSFVVPGWISTKPATLFAWSRSGVSSCCKGSKGNPNQGVLSKLKRDD